MAARTKKVAATTEETKATEAETQPKVALSPAQLATAKAYNDAYLGYVRLAAKANAVDGPTLVEAHKFSRNAIKALIAQGDGVCPMCSGTQVAI